MFLFSIIFLQGISKNNMQSTFYVKFVEGYNSPSIFKFSFLRKNGEIKYFLQINCIYSRKLCDTELKARPLNIGIIFTPQDK